MFGPSPEAVDHPDVQALSAWVDGALSRDEAATVREHTDHCDECARIRDRLRQVRHAVGRLGPPPTLTVLKPVSPPGSSRARWLVLAALLAVAIAATIWLLFVP